MRSVNLIGSVSRKAGGLFESVRRLVQCLAQGGMDVRVLGLADEFTQSDLPAWKPVAVSAFQAVGPGAFGFSPELADCLKECAPDLVHAHGLWMFPSVANRRYCGESRTPYLVSPHGMLDPWALRNSRWKKMLAGLLYEGGHLRGATCLRALCAAEARAMRQFGLKNPIAVVPNGVEPVVASGAAPGWTAQVERGRKVLLYLGRIHPKKGLANLLQAWRRVCDSGRSAACEWVLVIAGWDQDGHESELKRLAAELGSGPAAESAQEDGKSRNNTFAGAKVIFLGPQFGEAKGSCLAACEAFVLPSFSEGLPMAVLEAWAHGKPVWMTPQCNLEEGFRLGAAVRMEATVDSIESGLRRLLEMSGAERQEMGRRARALATERFGWERVAVEMEQVYGWVLGGGSRPSCLADF